MKKQIITTVFLLIAGFTNAQSKLSSTSEFINRSSFVQVNMDENEKAIFKSGLGEVVAFYPSDVTDLKSKEKAIGMAVESVFITGQQGMQTTTAKETAWIGIEEVADLITWFDSYVVPNLDQAAGKNKTVKYIFNCKEVMLKFEVYNNTQVFSVILNNTYFKDKYFWTESKVKDIPNVVKALKYLQTKKAI